MASTILFITFSNLSDAGCCENAIAAMNVKANTILRFLIFLLSLLFVGRQISYNVSHSQRENDIPRSGMTIATQTFFYQRKR
jgi:hypothetical protein